MVDYDAFQVERPLKMKIKYEDFLQTLISNFNTYPLKNHRRCTTKDKVCFLRHDVDFRIEWALELAEKEHDAGINSTYFMLHTMPYFYQDDFIDICKKIQDMGHEVGFHNSIISECLTKENMTPEEWNSTIKKYKISFPGGEIEWKLPEDCVLHGSCCYSKEPPEPIDLLKFYLNKLRERGLEIVGTAAHGSIDCRPLHFQPYHLFRDCDARHYQPPAELPFNLHEKPLKFFGLEYEAYFTDYDYYLSDGQDAWFCFPPGYDEWCPSNVIGKFIKDPLYFLNEVGKRDDSFSIQINTHPVWWFVDFGDMKKVN